MCSVSRTHAFISYNWSEFRMQSRVRCNEGDFPEEKNADKHIRDRSHGGNNGLRLWLGSDGRLPQSIRNTSSFRAEDTLLNYSSRH